MDSACFCMTPVLSHYLSSLLLWQNLFSASPGHSTSQMQPSRFRGPAASLTLRRFHSSSAFQALEQPGRSLKRSQSFKLPRRTMSMDEEWSESSPAPLCQSAMSCVKERSDLTVT